MQEQLPLWYDYAVDTAAGGVFKTSSFVVEEVLAEPVPLTMWGMEAIGSGVVEPLKAAWTLVKQVGRELLMKAIDWLLPTVLEEITRLTGLGAKEFGKLFDELLGPVIKIWNKLTDVWLGATQSIFATFNSNFMGEMMKTLQNMFYNLVDAVVPELSSGIRATQSVVKITRTRLCNLPNGKDIDTCILYRTNVLLETPEMLNELHAQQTLRIGTELKGQFGAMHHNYAKLKTSDLKPHLTFEDFLVQSSPIPTWIDHVIIPRSPPEPGDHWSETPQEPKKKATLLELLHESKKQGRGRKQGPTVHQLLNLHEITIKKLPEQMGKINKLLAEHASIHQVAHPAQMKQLVATLNQAQQSADSGLHMMTKVRRASLNVRLILNVCAGRLVD